MSPCPMSQNVHAQTHPQELGSCQTVKLKLIISPTTTTHSHQVFSTKVQFLNKDTDQSGRVTIHTQN